MSEVKAASEALARARHEKEMALRQYKAADEAIKVRTLWLHVDLHDQDGHAWVMDNDCILAGKQNVLHQCRTASIQHCCNRAEQYPENSTKQLGRLSQAMLTVAAVLLAG